MAWSIRDNLNSALLISSGLVTLGLVSGGYLLGDGLKRAKAADRSVTVRGLAEKNVTADLATWSIGYSATGTDLAAVRAEIDRNTTQLNDYFKAMGFRPEELQPVGAGVNQWLNNGTNNITINQRLLVRTTDIARAQRAVANQFDLVRRGVTLQEGSGMRYSFTRLNDVKPEMVAEATKDARKAAEQFAKDSGTAVGGIKSATQGYFSIESREGEAVAESAGDTPFKKVRVVTTVDFYLD